jgi:hypothetical protein
MSCFFFQTFSQAFYYLDYLIEKRAYIAQCVNISKPQMHCNGNCHLMKKMEAQEKGTAQAPELKSSKTETFSSDNSFPAFSASVLLQKKSSHFFYKQGKTIGWSTALFHPPGNLAGRIIS